MMQALKALAGAYSQEQLRDILLDNKGRVLGETRLVHFIDTGGQAIYHDVHPVLITSPSVYLVVFNLKELYDQKGAEGQLDYFRSDLIQRPLRSIYTFGTKNPQAKGHLQLHPEAPTVFIVGTHRDKLDKLSGTSAKDFLSDLHKMISNEIGNKPYRQFVQYDPDGRSFWAVDNTQAGKEKVEDKKYTSSLRKMVQGKSMAMSVKVPLPWMLLKLVMDMVMRKRYCKYSELLKEARTRGYVSEQSPNADLDTMLRLFHILGLIYHKVPSGYKREDSLVFNDPDCLYSATSDFLMAAKEEIEEQQQTHPVTVEGAEKSQGGSEEDQHETPAASRNDVEVVGKGNEKQKSEPQGIVHKQRVIERVARNSETIRLKMKEVLQSVLDTIGKKPTEAVLKSLHTELEKSERHYVLASGKGQDASSVKDKQQLFIGRLIHSLVSTVENLLGDPGKEEAHVTKVLKKAVEGVKARYESRSIDSQDMDQVLAILSDLRIIAKLSDSDYVIPAALPKVAQSMKDPVSAASVLVTVVSQTIMEVCYLPSGLFRSLISDLVTLHWTMIPVGRTHVAFTHKDFTGRVHLIEHHSYIEVKVESDASLDEIAPTCQAVRQSVHERIVHVYKELFSDSNAGNTFEESLMWGFQCEEHCTDDTHIAAFQDDGEECFAECLIESFTTQDVAPQQLVWFKLLVNCR